MTISANLRLNKRSVLCGAFASMVFVFSTTALSRNVTLRHNIAFAMSITTEVTATVNLDTDQDGAPNSWEVANGLDPLYPIDGLLDFDNDGIVNAYEFVDKTDPNDPASFRLNSYQHNLENHPESFRNLFEFWNHLYMGYPISVKSKFMLLTKRNRFKSFGIMQIANEIDGLRANVIGAK